MTLVEIKREPTNQEVVAMLERLLEQVRKADTADELLAYVKIDGDIHRFTTGLDDGMRMIAMLEVAKFDTLSQLAGG